MQKKGRHRKTALPLLMYSLGNANQSHSYLFQTTVLQQRICTRLFATEVFVHHHRIVDATRCQDILTELLRYLLVEDVASLRISLVSVAIQYLRPDVAVVASCVTTTHRVVEVGRTVTRRNLLQQTTTA